MIAVLLGHIGAATERDSLTPHNGASLGLTLSPWTWWIRWGIQLELPFFNTQVKHSLVWYSVPLQLSFSPSSHLPQLHRRIAGESRILPHPTGVRCVHVWVFQELQHVISISSTNAGIRHPHVRECLPSQWHFTCFTSGCFLILELMKTVENDFIFAYPSMTSIDLGVREVFLYFVRRRRIAILPLYYNNHSLPSFLALPNSFCGLGRPSYSGVSLSLSLPRWQR